MQRTTLEVPISIADIAEHGDPITALIELIEKSNDENVASVFKEMLEDDSRRSFRIKSKDGQFEYMIRKNRNGMLTISNLADNTALSRKGIRSTINIQLSSTINTLGSWISNLNASTYDEMTNGM